VPTAFEQCQQPLAVSTAFSSLLLVQHTLVYYVSTKNAGLQGREALLLSFSAENIIYHVSHTKCHPDNVPHERVR
jgi:hypothetical protein